MKINLINEKQYFEISEMQKSNEILTFQNDGYQYIDKSKLTESNKKTINKIELILKESIVGFCRFTNFKLTKKGEVKIRFQYNYGAEDNSMSFNGVGYILLRELLNGFD